MIELAGSVRSSRILARSAPPAAGRDGERSRSGVLATGAIAHAAVMLLMRSGTQTHPSGEQYCSKSRPPARVRMAVPCLPCRPHAGAPEKSGAAAAA